MVEVKIISGSYGWRETRKAMPNSLSAAAPAKWMKPKRSALLHSALPLS